MTKEQWQAIKNKDSEYDGKFFYVLRTTGTICRPSCEKKTSSPKNVIIFDTFEDAVAAGYHPCKRCRPEMDEWRGAKKELAEAAKKIVEENYKNDFSLENIADELHINKFYLVRTFKEVMGETLLQCHNRIRCEKAMEMLKTPELSMSYIAYETGFNSASHFTRVFGKAAGMTPSQYRKNYLESLDD